MSMDFSNWLPDKRPPENPPRLVDLSSGPHLFHIQTGHRTIICPDSLTKMDIFLVGWWRFHPDGTGEFAYGDAREEFSGTFTYTTGNFNWWLQLPHVRLCGAVPATEGCLHLFTIRSGPEVGEDYLTYMGLVPQPVGP